jgi:hypothetical protein
VALDHVDNDQQGGSMIDDHVLARSEPIWIKLGYAKIQNQMASPK